jgi:hypothetical protein
VRSTFDLDRDGWTVTGDTAAGAVIPDHVATGGNPGGFIRVNDGVAGGVMYWNAPPKFLGDFRAIYGTPLQFDLRQSAIDSPFDDTDVVLTGGGHTLTFDASPAPGITWTHYSVGLSVSPQWTKEGAGRVPTQAEFVATLADLRTLQIRAEYRSGPDIDDLDNVSTVGLPAPTLGTLANVTPLSGTVTVALPGSTARASATVPGLKGRNFVPLSEARQLPIGSILDTRRGRARLTTARGTPGATQTGEFTSGVFQVLQSRNPRARGLTELRLKGVSFARCRSRKAAQASRRSRRTIRRLRANANGRFRTRGRYSSATVRGTEWTTTDRCDGTLTAVRRGRVVVRDLRRKRNVLVRAGRRYLARAPG